MKHFEYIPISDQERLGLAQLVTETVKARIQSGLDINDAPAKPLSAKYARAKTRRGLKPIRDWKFSGKTLAAMGPVPAGADQIAVGFTDRNAAQTAAILNARDPQFGLSPADREKVDAAINDLRSARVKHA